MSSRKNPFTALALSAIVPGLGQIYNQEVKKGLVIFGSCLSLGLLTYWISGLNKFSTALALILIWISAMTDAYKVATTAGQPSDFYYRRTLCRRHVIARRSPRATIAVAKSTFFMDCSLDLDADSCRRRAAIHRDALFDETPYQVNVTSR